MSSSRRLHLLRRVLVGDRPARGAAGRAQLVVQVELVDLDDDAVQLVLDVVPMLAEVLDELGDLVDRRAHAVCGLVGRPHCASSSYTWLCAATGGSGQAPTPCTYRASESTRSSPASSSIPSFLSSCWRSPPLAALRGFANDGNRRAAAVRAFSSSNGFLAPPRASQRCSASAYARSRNAACAAFSRSNAATGMNTSPRTSTIGGCPDPLSRSGIPATRSAFSVTISPTRPSPRVAAEVSSPFS